MWAARIVVVMTGMVAVVLAGCTSAEDGRPTAASGVATSSSKPGKDETYGAPRVSNPLDASRFLTRPCDVLTQAQLKSLGIVRQGRPDTDTEIGKRVGPGCIWLPDPEENESVGVSFITGNKNGLSDIYRGHKRLGQFSGYFEETNVEGYPAVFAGAPDLRPRGECGLMVGIADTLTVLIDESGHLEGLASCDRARQVAVAVIATLKG